MMQQGGTEGSRIQNDTGITQIGRHNKDALLKDSDDAFYALENKKTNNKPSLNEDEEEFDDEDEELSMPNF